MPPLDRPIAEAVCTEEAGPRRPRPPSPYWRPRPSTAVAAVIVGVSLLRIAMFDPVLAADLSRRYGWPFRNLLEGPGVTAPRGMAVAAAMTADVGASLALLASACATTQIAACLLVRTPRVTLRALGFAVAWAALFLAGCRLKEGFLGDVCLVGFCYGLASLILLAACLLLRLELPRGDEAG